MCLQFVFSLKNRIFAFKTFCNLFKNKNILILK